MNRIYMYIDAWDYKYLYVVGENRPPTKFSIE